MPATARRAALILLAFAATLSAESFPVEPAAPTAPGAPPARAAESGKGEKVPPFVESIDVREVEILFDPSHLPRFESIGRRKVEDFSAYESGARHPLVDLHSTAPADWEHVLWFDAALAGPATRAAAALALADRASTLTAGGEAEIVVADPRPRTLVRTGSDDDLKIALGEIAARAQAEASGAPRPASVATRLAGLDRLAIAMAARGGAGAHALWIAVDGWPLSAEDLARWSDTHVAEDPERAAVEATARLLAGYGWVTYPVALRSTNEDLSPAEKARRVDATPGTAGDERTVVPIFSVSGSRATPGTATEAQFDALTDFTLAPVAALARATSGTLVGHPERLRAELAQLTGRKRATYRGPRPAPGALLPIEIRWSGGDGRVLPSTGYLRSAIPPELTAAKLRALAGGDAAPAAPAISLRAGEAGSRDVCFRTQDDAIPMRVSWAAAAADGATTLHVGEVRTVPSKDGAACLPLPAEAAAGRTFWLAENLLDESWTGGGTEAR